MSTPKDDGNCPSHNQDKNPAPDTNPPNKHHAITTTGPESQQPSPPIFDVAHHGWDASNVPTAKCDLCHRQRCGTLQKCRVCKLSICRECSAGGRLQNDNRHAIDTAAVDWDAPPTLRKRKRQASETGGEMSSSGTKKQRAGTRRGRGRRLGYESKGPLASSAVVADEAARALHGDVSWQSAARYREYGCDGPMEPRLSVAPASYYPSVSRVQGMNEPSPEYAARYEPPTTSSSYKRTLAIEAVRDDGGDAEQHRASLGSDGYHRAPAPEPFPRRPASPANDSSQAAPSQPALPPITPLLRDRRIHHHSIETFQIGSDILSRLDHLLHQHYQQPLSWPLHEHTESLGTSLAHAARASHHASSPPKPLDHCLREELQAVWTSRAFIAHDPDAGRRYRRLLAATYFASTRLGLEPRGNAAREWLCGEERKMRELGYEATKTAQLLDFLQEVGIWYLQQVQR